MLLSETGKPLIQHTYENAACAMRKSNQHGPERPGFDHLVVATDCEKIADAVRGFGGNVFLERRIEFDCGTERGIYAARNIAPSLARQSGIDPDSFKYDVVVLQGDVPDIDTYNLQCFVGECGRANGILTAVSRITSVEQLKSPSVVKVDVGKDGKACWFSRSIIPYAPDDIAESVISCRALAGTDEDWYPGGDWYAHVGIYGFPADVVDSISLFSGVDSALNRIESLEQIRYIKAGHSFKAVIWRSAPSSIDTREDYDKFVKRVDRSDLPVLVRR